MEINLTQNHLFQRVILNRLGKKLIAREVDGIVTIYYEGTNDVYEGPEATQYTTLEAAQGFCKNYNDQLNFG
jgi:hypothetical protein